MQKTGKRPTLTHCDFFNYNPRQWDTPWIDVDIDTVTTLIADAAHRLLDARNRSELRGLSGTIPWKYIQYPPPLIAQREQMRCLFAHCIDNILDMHILLGSTWWCSPSTSEQCGHMTSRGPTWTENKKKVWHQVRRSLMVRPGSQTSAECKRELSCFAFKAAKIALNFEPKDTSNSSKWAAVVLTNLFTCSPALLEISSKSKANLSTGFWRLLWLEAWELYYVEDHSWQ